MKKLIIAIVVLFTTVTMLEAKVDVSTASYQKKGSKWVKATKVVPGTMVKYINTLSNTGGESATNLVLVNNIPKEMKYIANSAKCQGKCTVTYSVDGGKSYNTSNKLYVKRSGRNVRAQAGDYTNIKWVVSSLNGGTKKTVEYSAILR
ncbi:MAG: DUF11 domain-containing protein [Campylobacterales bacterium]|nr:DUF11 domain-containing protein [Campylobacterales bacterium]